MEFRCLCATCGGTLEATVTGLTIDKAEMGASDAVKEPASIIEVRVGGCRTCMAKMSMDALKRALAAK